MRTRRASLRGRPFRVVACVQRSAPLKAVQMGADNRSMTERRRRARALVLLAVLGALAVGAVGATGAGDASAFDALTHGAVGGSDPVPKAAAREAATPALV